MQARACVGACVRACEQSYMISSNMREGKPRNTSGLLRASGLRGPRKPACSGRRKPHGRQAPILHGVREDEEKRKPGASSMGQETPRESLQSRSSSDSDPVRQRGQRSGGRGMGVRVPVNFGGRGASRHT